MNHPRIKSIQETDDGWEVTYEGGVLVERQEETLRTHNLRTGELLKRPVRTIQTILAPVSGLITVIRKRRKSLRRLGIRI